MRPAIASQRASDAPPFEASIPFGDEKIVICNETFNKGCLIAWFSF